MIWIRIGLFYCLVDGGVLVIQALCNRTIRCVACQQVTHENPSHCTGISEDIFRLLLSVSPSLSPSPTLSFSLSLSLSLFTILWRDKMHHLWVSARRERIRMWRFDFSRSNGDRDSPLCNKWPYSGRLTRPIRPISVAMWVRMWRSSTVRGKEGTPQVAVVHHNKNSLVFYPSQQPILGAAGRRGGRKQVSYCCGPSLQLPVFLPFFIQSNYSIGQDRSRKQRAINASTKFQTLLNYSW